MPELELKDETQIRRYNKAVKRRQARQRLQEMMKAIERDDDPDLNDLPTVRCP